MPFKRFLRLPMIGLLSILLTVPLFAHARRGGESGGGGGMVFVCIRDGKQKIFLADTYKFFESGRFRIGEFEIDLKNYPDKGFDIEYQAIPKKDPKLAKELWLNIGILKFLPVDELPILGDDDIKDIPAGCTKEQLGIQTFSKDTVRFNKHYFSALSYLEQKLFRLHEAYVRIYHRNSNTVRSSVLNDVLSENFILSLAENLYPETAVVKDFRSAELHRQLDGRSILCDLTAKAKQSLIANQRDHFDLFPLKLEFMDNGNGATRIAVNGSDKNERFVGENDLSLEYKGNDLILTANEDESINELSIDLSNFPRAMPALYRFMNVDPGIYDRSYELSCSVE